MVGFRLMGKREVGQLSVIDLIVSLMIAELCAISIENLDSSIWTTIAALAVLVGIQILLGFISLKSRKMHRIFTGHTSILINKGNINYKEMIKQRYSLDDLLLSLRQQSVKSIEDVEYAFLESNGKLSVFKYNFLKIPGSYPLPIIIDGVIQKDNLSEVKKSEIWLKFYLKSKDIELDEIFYGFYKMNKVYIIKHPEKGA